MNQKFGDLFARVLVLFGIWTAFMVFISGLILLSCADEYYIGKSKEELYREMFEVDSIIKTIQMQIDSTNIDFEKFYIDTQEINNEHE